jgi:hypothetical protein
MRPFQTSEKCNALVDTYPDPTDISSAIRGGTYLDRLALLRLWISEGIPFAFRSRPMIYEAAREWMAARLQVDPKSVTLIGSGRIGYSLSPMPKYGRKFDQNSDLDFSVIDHKLFSRVVSDYFAWEADFDLGRARPSNPAQDRFWRENLKRLPENIVRGFIDPYKIPSWNRYRSVVDVQQTLFLLGERLKATSEAPNVKLVTLRVYKDWRSFYGQMSLNLSLTVASLRLPEAPAGGDSN